MEKIEVIFYIEALSNEKKLLERAIEATVESLKGEKSIEVKDISVGDILEDEEEELLKYSGVIEARIVGSFRDVALAALRYSPAVVEVLRPGKMEISARELMEILGDVAVFMANLMEKFGGLAIYPKLDDLPEPKIGYSRDEIEAMIVEDRQILYRFVAEVYDKDEETARVNMAKALSYEGCRINKLTVQKAPNDDKKLLLAAEVLSDFETLFQLMAKYVPVALSIIEPEVIDVTAGELQNALTDISGFAQELITRPLKKQLMDRANTTFRLNP
ncbi:MAG: hypothetical protein J7L37_01810 [Thermococcus sp.]|nr:hypothetical protein [Thermococcus sp.]